MKVVRNSNNLNKVINDFLKRYHIINEEPPWVIQESELGGFGVFAKRDIEPGEIIFRDYPVILGPRAGVLSPNVCANCYQNNVETVSGCKNNCGLTICSPACQNASKHQKECKIISQWKTQDFDASTSSAKMLKCLAPIRSLLLSSEDKEVVQYLKAHMGGHHGFEVDILKDEMHLNMKEDEEHFMRFVCAILDANAFEVITGTEEKQSTLRGLYPLGGLANHCCIPNTFHVFDEQHIMIVRASVFISKGQELFHSYTRMIWGTPTRRYHLFKTKHFFCKCRRCVDPTEVGTYISALSCDVCKSNVLPIDSLNIRTKWQCEGCKKVVDEQFVSSRFSLLGSTLNSFDDDTDIKYLKRFLVDKLPLLVSTNNQVVIETQYKLIWILGYSPNHLWQELSLELLSLKEKMCRHILSVLEMLGTGLSKIRGLLLYELYCSLKWSKIKQQKNQRNGIINSVANTTEMNSLLHESADILMYDVSAPQEIKNIWRQREI